MRKPRKRLYIPRAGFQVVKDERCPSCEDRNALDLLGRPRFNGVYGFFKTLHCEECGGSGRVAVEDRRDPYDTGRGTSRIGT